MSAAAEDLNRMLEQTHLMGGQMAGKFYARALAQHAATMEAQLTAACALGVKLAVRTNSGYDEISCSWKMNFEYVQYRDGDALPPGRGTWTIYDCTAGLPVEMERRETSTPDQVRSGPTPADQPNR